jgi:hypothetical protein
VRPGLAILPSTEGRVAERSLVSLQLNFWKEVTTVGSEVDVMVPPHQLPFFTQLMADNDIATKLFIEDVQT